VAGVHFDSTVSGSNYTIEQLAQIAERYRLDVAIITDRDNAAVEFGIPPFRRLLRHRVEAESIRRTGAADYLGQIREAQRRHPSVILIAGAEAVPFYYWELDLRRENLLPPRPRKCLRIHKLHEHLLVLGLKNARQYEKLPSLATGYRRVLAPRALWNVLFLGLIVIGVRGVRRSQSHPAYARNRLPRRHVCLIALGSVLLLHGLIDWPREFDAYHGDPGVGPYQSLIDYVNDCGGMVFWAHPEAGQDGPVGGIHAHTDPYHTDLLRARDYTGFAIFWEGINKIGCIGGIWDQVLAEYCRGRRSGPVWALSELDFEGSQGVDTIRESLTVLLAAERTEQGALEAIRAGRMYSLRNYAADALRLDRFAVHSPATQRAAIMGETLATSSPPHVRIDLRVLGDRFKWVMARLVRSGETIAQFDAEKGLHVDYVDDAWDGDKTYYRLMVYGDGYSVLASNPIFVDRGPWTRR